ncbi:ankyrin repeat-containing domain protein [Hypoxylon argillaceum]|nr:ankyrin repeat-containing domain protein [Hypoxylon argillaceum]
MQASAIGAAVLSLAADATRVTCGAKSHGILDREDAEIERTERDARKVRQLEASIQDYQHFLGAVAKVEEPIKKGPQGFIDPKWVHGLDIPKLFNKQHLFDKLAIVFDPFECEFAALNQVMLYRNDYDVIDLPSFNYPFDIITIFGDDIDDGHKHTGGAETEWTFMAKAKSKPYKRGDKSAREQVVTYPLVALGRTVILQRLSHIISKLYVLKTKPSRVQGDTYERHYDMRTLKSSHVETDINKSDMEEGKKSSALHHVARRMMRDILLKDEMAEFAQGRNDLDAVTNRSLERIMRVRMDVLQLVESQADPSRLHHEAAQVLAEWVASSGDVQDAANHLLNAAKEHESKIIRKVLEQDEKPPAIDSSIAIELQFAAQRGMASVLEYLFSLSDGTINARSAINQRSDDGYTPLSLAAIGGHVGAVTILLEHEPDVDLEDHHGRTALSLAAGNGHLNVVDALLQQKSNPNAGDYSGRTPLSWAATGDSRRGGSYLMIKSLVARGANVNLTDKTGRSPLSWAAQMGNDEAVMGLLLEEAEPDLADEANRRTPLWWAAGSGYNNIVCSLLDRGARPDSHDRFGRTPLSWAAANGHADVVALLLNSKVMVDSRDKKYGRTPMSWAAEAGHHVIVSRLIDHDANLNSLSLPQGSNLLGRPPLSFAAAQGHLEVVEILIKHSASVDPPYGPASREVEELVSSQYSRFPPDNFSRPTFIPGNKLTRAPLSWAAGNGHAEVVKELLGAGSQPDFADEYGRTALWYAARNGHGPVTALLLTKGADPNIRDCKGSSALDQGYLMEHSGVVRKIRDEQAEQPAPSGKWRIALRRTRKVIYLRLGPSSKRRVLGL